MFNKELVCKVQNKTAGHTAPAGFAPIGNCAPLMNPTTGVIVNWKTVALPVPTLHHKFGLGNLSSRPNPKQFSVLPEPLVGYRALHNKNKMIIKSKTTNRVLLAEGTYAAKVGSVKGKPDDSNPKKIMLGYKIEQCDEEIFKELPASFEDGTPLRKDVETIFGRQLNRNEADAGIDLNTLIDKECNVIVMHRSGSGGRPVPVVSLVLPSANQTTRN
jgi:hypothetical protein